MYLAVIPIALLLTIVLVKKIPKIGGNIYAALFITGFVSLMLGKVFNPVDWLKAFIDGIDRIAWVMALALFGSIYSEAQVELGTVDTIMSALKARFKNSPRALVVSVLLVLVLAGSLLGDAIAASTVVGVLTISTMAFVGLAPEAIAAIIVMGASLGSIMPPMTQSIALAATLVGTDPDPVMAMGYPTVAICVVAVCLYVVFFMMRKIKKVTVETDRTAWQIISSNIHTLIPLFGLIIVVFLRTVNTSWKFDLMPWLIGRIKVGDGTLYTLMTKTPIVKGLSNGIVLCIVFALIISFCFPKVYKNAGKVLKGGLKNVRYTLLIQLGCGFMLGAFYRAGQIQAVQDFAQGLHINVLILGGVIAMCLIGMLTGSQTTTQNAIFTFFGPALVAAAGVAPMWAALAGANLAMAGQGMPPADLTTFVVCGIVGGVLNKKCDPIKSMLYSMFMCGCFIVIALCIMYLT